VGGGPMVVPPCETALGSLVAYITDSSRQDFQPMNANYGLMPDLRSRARGRQKKIEMGTRALAAIDDWIARNGLEPLREPQAEAGAPDTSEAEGGAS
jgi:methylenetetrahydrofolate--tRNA-(uracil-5-)-methyltransferase